MLTAAETQLTKGFSLSPAATPRHSAVASGKAADFPSARAMCKEGWRASMLPTTTATTLSATTSIPRTGGGFAALAVLQKLGHPHPPLHAPSESMVWFTRMHTRLFYHPTYSVSIHIHLSIYLSIYSSIYLSTSIPLSICRYLTVICSSAHSTHDSFSTDLVQNANVELHCY